ncbi:MAG: hypothetical protein WAV23_02370 [Minisyncoccia bacterium]
MNLGVIAIFGVPLLILVLMYFLSKPENAEDAKKKEVKNIQDWEKAGRVIFVLSIMGAFVFKDADIWVRVTIAVFGLLVMLASRYALKKNNHDQM